MQPTIIDDQSEKFKYIFFDIECTQDTMFQCEKGFFYNPVTEKCVNCQKADCGSLQHKPNCCVVHKVCELCHDSGITSTSTCSKCGPNRLVFTGLNTLDDFSKWLFTKANKRSTVFCHNFKGYDSYPILSYLYRNAIIPKIIPNGSKNMSIEIPHLRIKFLESILYQQL